VTHQAIIDFVLQHYGDKRRALAPLLLRHLDDDAFTHTICDAICEGIPRPILAQTFGSEEKDARLRNGTADLEDLGDTADTYTIVLNPEIDEITDWDFVDFLKAEREVHVAKVWINWFIPVYFMDCSYDRGIQGGTAYEFGPLEFLSPIEEGTCAKIHRILGDLGLQSLDLAFLQQRFPELSTDLVEENASLHECLFSDMSYPVVTKGERKGWWARIP
jgi:hypothetical protein